MAWIFQNWPMILSVLWGVDQIMVSIFGKTTVLDGITSFLQSLGAGK